MEAYIQPKIERAPSNVIIKTSTDPEQIAESIFNLAKSMKADKNYVIISGLTPQNDRKKTKK